MQRREARAGKHMPEERRKSISICPKSPSPPLMMMMIPYLFLCPICKALLADGAFIPCCGNSYCEECIRTALLESEEHTCPACQQRFLLMLQLPTSAYPRTPLHLACANGHTEVARFLVKHGSQLDAVDNFGRTPLMKAVQFHQEDCVAFLLEHGADPNLTDTDGHTALHLAIQAHNKNLVGLLLRHYVDHRAKNKESFTPLALAISEHQEEIVEILLKAGVDVHAQDRHQRTPLMIAASVGQLNLVQGLLSCRAKVSHEDRDGNTAEDYADLHGYWSLSQYLAKLEDTAEAPAGDAEGDNILKILRIPERAGAAGELEIKTEQEKTGEAPVCDTEDIPMVTSPEQAGAAPFMWGAPAVDRGATDDLCEGGSVRSSEEEGNDDTWSDSEDSICFSPKVKKQQKPNLLELWDVFLKYRKAGLQVELEALQKEKAEEGQWRSLCGSQEESPEEEELEENQEQEELDKELWAAIAACVTKYILNESPDLLTGTAENKPGWW